MNNEYITKDLGEAAALLTSKQVMLALHWKEGIAYFSFDESESCQKLAHQYFFENLELPVRNFYENLRIIKRKLYAEQNNSKGGGR